MPATPAFKILISNAVALAVGGVLAQLAFVMLEAVIARKLGVSAYGTFSTVYAYALILVHLLDLGVNWQVLQEGSRDRTTLGLNLTSALAIKLGSFLIAYPAMLAVLHVSGQGGEIVQAFAIFAFFALAMMVQDALATVFAATQRMMVSALYQAAVPVAMLGAVMVLSIAEASLPRILLACVLGTALVTLFWYMATAQVIQQRFSLARAGQLIKRGYHYGVTMTLNAFYFRIGVLLLSMMRSPAEVGLFAAAYKLLELGYKIPTLVIRVVAPKLFTDSSNDPGKFRWEVDMLLRLTVGVSALMAVVVFIVGPSVVLMIFGAKFTAAGGLAQVIGFALALKSVALMAQTILSTADEHGYRMRADVLTTLASVALAIPLIRAEGALGAAIAVAAADFVWATLMMSRLWRHLPGTSMTGIVLPPVIGAALAIAAATTWHVSVIGDALMGTSVLFVVLLASGHLNPVLAESMKLLRGTR